MWVDCAQVEAVLLWNVSASAVVAGVIVSESFQQAACDGVLETASY